MAGVVGEGKRCSVFLRRYRKFFYFKHMAPRLVYVGSPE